MATIGDVLYLHAATISSHGQQKLKEALRDNKTLRAINLQKCRLSDAIVEDISTYIRANKVLIALQFPQADFSDSGVSQLLQSLGRNCTLISLSLSKCALTDEAIPSICSFLENNKTMTDLLFLKAEFSNSGFSNLMKPLSRNSTLKQLCLWESCLSDNVIPDLCSFVEVNEVMSYLTFHKAVFTDAGLSKILQSLCRNNTMITLQLWESCLTDSVVRDFCLFLQENKVMTYILFQKSTFTDHGLSRLLQFLSTHATLADITIESPLDDDCIEPLISLIKESSLITHISSVDKGQDPCLEVTKRGEPQPSYYYVTKVGDKITIVEEQDYLQKKVTGLTIQSPQAAAAGPQPPRQSLRSIALPDKFKSVLKKNRMKLVDLIEPSRVLDYLRQEDTLTEEEEADITLNATRHQQVRRLLDLLSRKSLQDYENFKQGLIESQQTRVYDLITEAERKTGPH